MGASRRPAGSSRRSSATTSATTSSRDWSATTRPAFRSVRHGAGATFPNTGSPPRAPTTPSASWPRCTSEASSWAKATDAPRRRPSRPPPRRRSPTSKRGKPRRPAGVPELPEVEVIRRDLEKEVVGRQICAVEVRNTRNAMRVIRRHAKRRELEEPLTGAKVMGVDRRGKYLVFHLDGDLALVIHLGMSGQLVQTAAEAGMQNHTHVVFDLCD